MSVRKDRRSTKKTIAVSEPTQRHSAATLRHTIPVSKPTFLNEVERSLMTRKANKIMEHQTDLTPKLLVIDEKLKNKYQTEPAQSDNIQILSEILNSSFKSTIRENSDITMQSSLEDIMSRISLNIMAMSEVPFWRATEGEEESKQSKNEQPQYIKINLQETDDILIFQKPSVTVPKDSEEAALVEADNRIYEELTVGKKRIRRRVDSEAQTAEVLYKTRDTNTEHTKTASSSAFVSNYDMYDTYKDLQKETSSVEIDDKKTFEITTYKVGGIDQFAEFVKTPSFQIATMLTQRVLAGNTFRNKQKRFRNMEMPDPLSLEVRYKYRLEELWAFPAQKDKERRAVAAIDWCPKNGDIVAVAYGIYTFVPVKNQAVGYICIWSIKNPVNPEHRFEFNVPVVSLQFSPYNPQLLAVGFYDGSVEVHDVTTYSYLPVSVSQRLTSPGCEPVTKICWISVGSDNDADCDQFLATSQNGSVTKYKVTRSPYLLGFQQILLDRVEGTPEGLSTNITKKDLIALEASRHPTALTMTLHPTRNDIYYVLTDEGCMHKCSINHPHQHMELLKVHNGSAFSMQFNPWSPKLFLTCGSDWYIRIWMEGIFTPLIKLSNGIGPIHYAEWSKTHATVIISVTRKAIEIWDIRRNILQPVSVTPIKKSYFTVGKLSNCGRSFLVGNEAGEAYLYALEDMPFPPYFQYKELEAAVFKSLVAFPELVEKVKSIGNFGYSESQEKD